MRREISERDEEATRNLWRISGMGMELALAIGVMALIGYGLDAWLGTRPTLTIIGLVVGALAGGYNFVRTALQLNRAAQASYRNRRREPVSDDKPRMAEPRPWTADVTPDDEEEEWESDDFREPDDFDKY